MMVSVLWFGFTSLLSDNLLSQLRYSPFSSLGVFVLMAFRCITLFWLCTRSLSRSEWIGCFVWHVCFVLGNCTASFRLDDLSQLR